MTREFLQFVSFCRQERWDAFGMFRIGSLDRFSDRGDRNVTLYDTVELRTIVCRKWFFVLCSEDATLYFDVRIRSCTPEMNGVHPNLSKYGGLV